MSSWVMRTLCFLSATETSIQIKGAQFRGDQHNDVGCHKHFLQGEKSVEGGNEADGNDHRTGRQHGCNQRHHNVDEESPMQRSERRKEFFPLLFGESRVLVLVCAFLSQEIIEVSPEGVDEHAEHYCSTGCENDSKNHN